MSILLFDKYNLNRPMVMNAFVKELIAIPTSRKIFSFLGLTSCIHNVYECICFNDI